MIRFLQTPGPVKKIVLSSILLVFCGAMVITLIPGGLTSSLGAPSEGVVAKVAGEDVTRQEVMRVANNLLRQQFPRGQQASQFLPFFAPRAADQLITERAIISEAERMGLRATPDDVRDELQHGVYAATFFPGGNFIGEDKYQDLLQQNELTVDQFEKNVHDQILFRKVRSLITASASVSEQEVREEFQKRNTKVKFQYAVIQESDLKKGLHPTESELKAFYERNKASYTNTIPEKRKIAYVLLDTNKIANQTSVSQEELQAYYREHRDEYRVPAQVDVRHILVKTPPPGPDGKVDQKAVDAARAKAEDILKQVKAGANFADLAKKYSDDPGSAKKGGSLGWIQRNAGGLDPAFEQAAFSLAKGGTSELVKSSFGFHIIHVDDRQDAHVKPFDEVKAQIEPLVRQNKAARVANQQADAFLSQARANGLEKAAAAKGLPVTTTDFFANTDSLPGIGASRPFAEAVFSERENSPPDLAQLPQGYVIFRLLAVKPPATPSFEEIRSRVQDEFLNERAAGLLSQKTQELSDRAKAGHDLKKAARELGATMKTSDFVLPDGQVPDIGSMSGPASVVFSMKTGEISGPIVSGASGAVLQLLERQEPPPQEFAQQQDAIRDSLLQQKRAELFEMFVSNLRQSMEKSGQIKINQEEMKGLSRGVEQGE
jgi:peptidyl-prolyl cis-trans isomerase D